MTDPIEPGLPGTKVKTLRELQAGEPPARDLWSDIENRIRALPAQRHTTPVTGHARHSPLPLWAVAVAVAAACVLITVGVWIGRGGPAVNVAQNAAAQASAPDALTRDCLGDSRYLRERTALLSSPTDALSGLPADSRQRVVTSLTTIHNAIHDLQTALATDAANPLLQELLLHTCRDETRVLTEVHDASAINQPGQGT